LTSPITTDARKRRYQPGPSMGALATNKRISGCGLGYAARGSRPRRSRPEPNPRRSGSNPRGAARASLPRLTMSKSARTQRPKGRKARPRNPGRAPAEASRLVLKTRPPAPPRKRPAGLPGPSNLTTPIRPDNPSISSDRSDCRGRPIRRRFPPYAPAPLVSAANAGERGV
jgi:hypothetical protein